MENAIFLQKLGKLFADECGTVVADDLRRKLEVREYSAKYLYRRLCVFVVCKMNASILGVRLDPDEKVVVKQRTDVVYVKTLLASRRKFLAPVWSSAVITMMLHAVSGRFEETPDIGVETGPPEVRALAACSASLHGAPRAAIARHSHAAL